MWEYGCGYGAKALSEEGRLFAKTNAGREEECLLIEEPFYDTNV